MRLTKGANLPLIISYLNEKTKEKNMTDFYITLTPEQEFKIRAQIRSIIVTELDSFSKPKYSEQRYLNKKQTCAYLNVSNNTLTNWIALGLPCIQINGAIRFDKKAVDAWLSKLATP